MRGGSLAYHLDGPAPSGWAPSRTAFTGTLHGRRTTGGYVAERTAAWEALPLPREHDPPHILAGHALITFRAIAREGARLVRAEAALLSSFRRAHAEATWGFARFEDFAREVLALSSRSAKRRLALHRTLEATAPLADAFLAGRLTTCQVLALAPVAQGEAAAFWIELAETLTVRELNQRVREAKSSTVEGEADAETDAPGEGDTGADDETGRAVTFSAPSSAVLAWDHGLETARRVLGWEAPDHLCVEAILAEAASSFEDPPEETADPPASSHVRGSAAAPAPAPAPASASAATRAAPSPPSAPPSSSPRVRPPRPREVRRLRQTLSLIAQEMETLRALAAPLPGPRADLEARLDPQTGVTRFLTLHQARRPLRLLEGRLLRDLVAIGGLRALGCVSLRDFAETHLGLSERTARGLISEAYLFDDEPRLARAFETGAIGVGQAFLIRRIMLTDTLPGLIRRAREVTYLQFAREVRFLERLYELAPDLANRFAGPLPEPGLEAALVTELAACGVTPEALVKAFRSRALPVEGLALTADQDSAAHRDPAADQAPAADGDPAANPLLMRRLEALLELLVLARESEPPIPETHRDLADPTLADRQMLAPGATRATIHFWLPDPILDQWNDAVRRVCARWGPLPTWAAAILLVESAVREWERIDPERIPTEVRIMERDGYRCTAPGCSSRRSLEGHHIHFRSQRGGDELSNRTALCAVHHDHRIHGPGTIRLRGTAPGDLIWEMGCAPGRAPLLVFHGHKIVRRHHRAGRDVSP